MKFGFKKKNTKTSLDQEIIRIEKTNNTPEIILDKSNAELKVNGSSYPEDATVVYDPILEWIEKNTKEKQLELVCSFYFDFLSSSSHKMIYEILLKLENIISSGKAISVIWYYDEYDEDIMEQGEDFIQRLDIPFKLIAKQE